MTQPTPRKDLRKLEIGARYNNFTVIAYVGHEDSDAMWLFRCDCGNYRKRYASAIVNRHSRQCSACQRAALTRNKPIHTARDAVIVAARAKGLPVPAIAADMGLTPSTVHGALVRASRRGVAA